MSPDPAGIPGGAAPGDAPAAAELDAVLSGMSAVRAFPARLSAAGRALLGRPYRADTLVGGPGLPERLVTRLDAFDCVTFVETVLALAAVPPGLGGEAARRAFAHRLAALRYLRGRVRYRDRNHYFVQWIRRNARAGLVHALPRGYAWGGPPRRLALVPGVRPVRWRPRFLPVDRAAELVGRARAGDVAAFVSTRDDLDVFHVGLLAGRGALLRHASRSAGRVVEEPLAAFLARNTTPGLLLARPLPGRPPPFARRTA